jgi:predicted nucleotidyltransferase
MSPPCADASDLAIPGIPEDARKRLLSVLSAAPNLQAVWLFGSRAMGRYQPGSDIDICLEGPRLSHADRLRLMVAVDDLLLPWKVDLVPRHELPADLEAHVQRVGRCLWVRSGSAEVRTPVGC